MSNSKQKLDQDFGMDKTPKKSIQKKQSKTNLKKEKLFKKYKIRSIDLDDLYLDDNTSLML